MMRRALNLKEKTGMDEKKTPKKRDAKKVDGNKAAESKAGGGMVRKGAQVHKSQVERARK
jgi:hypothetical protein